MEKLLLTPEEAADVLSISRSKLYELIGCGRLSSVRIDASRRIPAQALIDFIDGLQHPTDEAFDARIRGTGRSLARRPAHSAP